MSSPANLCLLAQIDPKLIFTHLKLSLADTIHNFKWVKIHVSRVIQGKSKHQMIFIAGLMLGYRMRCCFNIEATTIAYRSTSVFVGRLFCIEFILGYILLLTGSGPMCCTCGTKNACSESIEIMLSS